MVARQEYHLDMWCRFTKVFLAAVVSVVAAFAQGPPASVTSPGFGGNRGGGPPASVTSPGFGRTSPNRFSFTQPTNHHPSGARHPNFFPRNSFGGAVYAFPVPY